MSKVMLVTGGGRGIGAATARLAAKRGYAVCVNYTVAPGTVATEIHASSGDPDRLERIGRTVPIALVVAG